MRKETRGPFSYIFSPYTYAPLDGIPDTVHQSRALASERRQSARVLRGHYAPLYTGPPVFLRNALTPLMKTTLVADRAFGFSPEIVHSPPPPMLF